MTFNDAVAILVLLAYGWRGLAAILGAQRYDESKIAEPFRLHLSGYPATPPMIVDSN